VLVFQIGASPINILAQIYNDIGLFVLLAIPFFLFAVDMHNAAGLTKDMVRQMNAAVGRMRSGQAQSHIVVSMVFACISVSSSADTAAVGSVMIPAMERAGFTSRFAAAVTAASSTMGNIIPPSLYMIIYGSMAGVSIEKLFLAGIIPGLLVGFSQMGL